MINQTKTFMAIDLGATSGRTILGQIVDGRLIQHELTRFPNNITQVTGHYLWDIYALYNEIIRALHLCAESKTELTSIGIDTWGVDFVCVGRDGQILRTPYCYRDPYTDGIMDDVFARVNKYKVYEKTGIQFLSFNTLFQLAAARKMHDSALEAADKVLFIPDALTYMLTGEAICEYTILSTSQLLNPRTRQIDSDLLDIVGLDPRHFGRMTEPGTVVGTLSAEVQQMTGMGPVPVVAVAGHDTASAVAAIPAQDAEYAYLSCGTWSLLGIETPEPVISEKSFEYNFTNEGGIEGTTRLLKNICGMWLLERCRSEWTDAPSDVSQISRDAMDAPPMQSIIAPDDPRFANPKSMTEAIRCYCRETGQHVPQDYREMARCIFESLALRYCEVIGYLQDITSHPIHRLHVIGGGSQNQYLMQMTADAIKMPVITGPVEGTAIGNIMLQAKAAGLVADRFEMRRIIAASVETRTYMPTHK